MTTINALDLTCSDLPEWDRRFDGLPDCERCKVCGQADNCGDCNHVRLADSDADFLMGRVVTRAEIPFDYMDRR